MRTNHLDLVFVGVCMCGCGAGSTRGPRTADAPPTCSAAAIRIFDTMSIGAVEATRDDLAEHREETIAISRYACSNDGWSDDAIACFAAAPTEPALTACSDQLTTEQRAGYASTIVAAFELATTDARAAAR